jgi:hypothetical protein
MASLQIWLPAILLAGCGVPRPDASRDAAVPVTEEASSQAASAFVADMQAEPTLQESERDWSFVQVLAEPEPAEVPHSFGRSVALTASWAAIGAPAERTVGESSPVSVYALKDQLWQRAYELSPPAGEVGGFGTTIAMDDDVIVVGAPLADLDASASATFDREANREAISRTGAVYVFTRTEQGFLLTDELRAPMSQAWQGFGASLALDGDRLVVGAPDRDQGGLKDAGGAFVFRRLEGHFVFSGELTAPLPAAGDGFGRAVALLGDTLVAGASLRDEHGQADAGAVYVFFRQGSDYTLRQTVTTNTQARGLLGASLALSYTSGLKQRLLVGAPGVDAAEQAQAGAVFVFESQGASSFDERTRLTSNAPAADSGFGLSLAQDRSWVLVGSQGDPSRTPPELFASSPEGLEHHSLLLPSAGMGSPATNGSIALAQGNLLWATEAIPGHDEPTASLHGTVHAFRLND